MPKPDGAWHHADIDQALGFTIPGRHARGRLVRLGPVLDAILANHGYPPAIERLLAEALTLTALLGSTLKDSSPCRRRHRAA
jgi:molecular chaperone Hsp33